MSAAGSEPFRQAFEEAPTGMAIVAPEGRFRWVNAALCRITGHSRSSLLDRRFHDITHPDDLEADLAQLARLAQGEVDTYTVEKRYLRPDGSLVMAQLDVSATRHDDATVASYLAHVQDIAGRRATQDALAAANVALCTSQNRFAALVERSSDIICVIDPDGYISYASPAGERLLGYGHGSQIGTRFGSLFHPDDLPELRAVFYELLEEPGGTRTAEARMVSAGGDWRHVEIVATNRQDDLAVGGVVANVRDVTERTQAVQRLAWLAYHDDLTGLPNRMLFAERLHQAVDRSRQAGSETAVLYLDLDRLKLVNDSMGHDAGDQLLAEVANRLRVVVRAADTVARLGGDEFAVLLEMVEDREVACSLAERIAKVVAAPVALALGEVSMTTSVGVAFDAGPDPEQLLRDADIALYRAKEQGRNRCEVFDDALREATLAQMADRDSR